MFENVDGRTDAGVIGILIAHLGALGSGELKKICVPTLPQFFRTPYPKHTVLFGLIKP